MVDQNNKPTEGVEAAVEAPEGVNNESLITNDTPEVQQAADAKAEEHSEKDIVQDGAGDVNQDTAQVQVNDGETTDAPETIKDGVEEKSEKVTQEPSSTKDTPKEMLKVTKMGSRQRSDASVLPDSDDPKAIRKQVEFYFSDSNLPTDKFLWEKTDGENNKPVLLSLLCSFSRMRRFKPYSAVVEALKASKHLVVEGSEGEETVRRKQPYIEADDKQREVDERSTYVKGFGEEQSSTQFDVEAFFTQFGEFKSIRLRRTSPAEKSIFKGSVFVEWADKETADKFLALEPKPLWKEHPMKFLSKVEYKKLKAQEIRDGKVQMKGGNQFGNRGQRGGRFGRGGPRQSRGNHRNSDSNDWKKRRDDDQRNGNNDRGGRRDRGGRSRGRGRGNGRGRGRDRGPNENGRATEDQAISRENERPTIHTSKEGEKIMKESNGKRAREDDAATSVPPAKKVDVKEA